MTQTEYLMLTSKFLAQIISFVLIASLGSASLSYALSITLIDVTKGSFQNPIGIDHFEPKNEVVLSVNYPSGVPHNFELIDKAGNPIVFTTLSGFTEEIKIASARNDGVSSFPPGTLFTGIGQDGRLARINPDETFVVPWVILPDDPKCPAPHGLMRGSLYVDRTGVYGGDLIIVTTDGEVWRIDSSGSPTCIDSVGDRLEGVITVPDDAVKYGPLAGKIIAGAQEVGLMYILDNDGFIETRDVGVDIEDIDLITENGNFFGVNFGTSKLLGAPASEFDGEEGKILLTQEFGEPSGLFILSWDGASLITEPVELNPDSEIPGQWEHVTFSTAGISPILPNSVDHYLFYNLKIKKDREVSREKKDRRTSQNIEITLADQFTPEGEVRHFLAKGPIELGNPADKNGEGIVHPETHLLAYKIQSDAHERKLHSARKLPELLVSNQLGAMTVKISRTPKRLLVPSAKSLEGPVDPLENSTVDHFQCYGIYRFSKFAKQAVSVVDQFENPIEIELTKPQQLCTPTNKNGEGINNDSQILVCYTIRTDSEAIGWDVDTNNQFGPLEGRAWREQRFCVPSTMSEVP